MHKITAVMTCAESAASQSISYNICCIESGNDASITTVWFNPHYKKGNIIPTYEVHSHQEFLDLLNDLNEKKLNV